MKKTLQLKQYLTIIFLSILFFSCSTKELDFSQLQERNGVYYEINKEKPFTGIGFKTFENGQFMLKSDLKKGLLDGTTYYWDESGELKVETNYKEGKPHGKYFLYNQNNIAEEGSVNENTIVRKRFYKDGSVKSEIIKEGEVNFSGSKSYDIKKENASIWHITTYQEDGSINSEEKYVNGNGFKKEFWSNGNLSYESTYKDYKLDGVIKSYLKDGTLNSHISYEQGQLHGLTFMLDDNLDTISLTNRQFDLKDGLCKEWTNGIIKEATQYKEGEKHGSSMLYYPNGILMKEAAFEDGYQVNEWLWYNTDGSIRPHITTLDGTNWVTSSGTPIWFTSSTYNTEKRYKFNCYTNQTYRLDLDNDNQKLILKSLNPKSYSKYIEYQITYLSNDNVNLQLLPTKSSYAYNFRIMDEGSNLYLKKK